jgi:hypothetical protein
VRLYATWPAWLFARDPAARYEAHPLDGSHRPDDGAAVDDLPPAWCLAGGVPLPRAQRPDLVLVRPPAPGAGRLVRNPAWSVLHKYGAIRRPGTLRHFREHHQAAWPAELAAYAARRPRRLGRIAVEVHQLARAFGLPGGHAEVRRMLAGPAEPLRVPGLTDVQLFRSPVDGGANPTLVGPGYSFELAGRGRPLPTVRPRAPGPAAGC